jgi:hypothetical protein
MIDGFSPAPQRTIAVQTAGVGAVRGAWPAKDPSVIQDFWLDLTRQVVSIIPPDPVATIAVSVVSAAETPPVVTYSGTDGMMAMLRVSGGTDGDNPTFGITVQFASGRSLVVSAVLPIRAVAGEASPPGQGAATLEGSTAIMGGGEVIAGPSSIDLSALSALPGSPQQGDGLVLIRPPSSNAPDLPGSAYLYSAQLLATGSQLEAETTRAQGAEETNATSISALQSTVSTLQAALTALESSVATISAGGLSQAGLVTALNAALTGSSVGTTNTGPNGGVWRNGTFLSIGN